MSLLLIVVMDAGPAEANCLSAAGDEPRDVWEVMLRGTPRPSHWVWRIKDSGLNLFRDILNHDIWDT